MRGFLIYFTSMDKDHVLYQIIAFGWERDYFTFEELKDSLESEVNLNLVNAISAETAYATSQTLLFKFHAVKTPLREQVQYYSDHAQAYAFYGEETRLVRGQNIIQKNNNLELLFTVSIYETYQITPIAASRYVELQELREARKNAQESKILSVGAIEVAVMFGILQVVIGLVAFLMSFFS
jgi:hypothetical protein